MVPETSCFDAQIADSALEAIMQATLAQCPIPNSIKTQNNVVACDRDTGWEIPGCLVAQIDESAILPAANFEKLDTAIELVFGEGASVGFVCSIADSFADGKPLPGRCCLDAPYSKANETTWGQPVRAL